MSYLRFIFLGLLLSSKTLLSQEMQTVIDLSGKWNFSIGDNPDWSKVNFDDSDWGKINVPDSWESQGYYGYDGIAWYRKTIFINSDLANQNLYLELGYIDDVDEVFINGVKIGFTGSFPPNYKTAYNAKRTYFVPKNLLKINSENSIAVRVFDEQLEGGILRGNIRLVKEKNPLFLDVDLQGVWRFQIGDNLNWSNLKDYSDWHEIMVPGIWENQGFYNYDGFAWYVTQFTPTESLINKDLVLVLGKIDDIDELYINGEFVASTGEFTEGMYNVHVSFEYNEFRGYYLNRNIFKPDTLNTIAVRVYDGRGDGGIYKGPVGIISQDKYIKYWRARKESR